MANKCEILKSVKKNVVENGIKVSYYCVNGQYCAVGHLLKELGVSDADLETLGGAGIDQLMDLSLSEVRPHRLDIAKNVQALLNEAGFDVAEMESLQSANDSSQGIIKPVIAVLDDWMTELSC